MLFLIGFIPLPLGYIMNRLMVSVYYDKVLPYGAIGIVFLIAWFVLGLATYNFIISDREAIVIVHLFGFVDLLLILFQEVILKNYWFNQIGTATQFFYLPLVNVAEAFTFFSSRIYWTYVVAFVLMCAAFTLGRKIKTRRTSCSLSGL